MSPPDRPLLELHIDGQHREAAPGSALLDLLQQQGRALPALCSDPRLAPAGDCGLCAVEISRDGGLSWHNALACRTPAEAGLQVRSRSAALDAFYAVELRQLAAYASAEDMARFPDKPLHRALQAAGVAPAAEAADPARVDASHPLIHVDMNRCIRCFRCVRICEEVQGQSVWHALGRGSDIRIVADTGVPLGESSCVGCGACVDSCPSAALTDARAHAPATAWTRSVCPYCGVGCEIEIGTREQRIVEVRPALDSPVNKGHLCVKGRYAWGHAESVDRLRQPRLRDALDAPWREVDWDQALHTVAADLRRILDRDGPDAIGVLGSARATNEENYLAQKFARVALGTHNVDNCARVCHTPSAAALKTMLGTGAACNSFDDIERAGLIVLAGCNPTSNHPVVGARIRQQVKRGAKLIVIDPRRTELAALADIHLALRPGTNIPLLNALAKVILDENLQDDAFIARRVEGVAELRAHLAPFTPEFAAAECGLDAAQIVVAARLYAGTRPALCFHGLGLTENRQGTEAVMGMINLALLCGQIGQPGAGINPLRGQNNVQGAAHMGCDPSILPGSISVKLGKERAERVWGVGLSASHGLNLMQMIDAAEAGRLKALVVMGFDILTSLPHRARLQAALAKLERLVVIDPWLNETAEHVAHAVLPALTSFEKDGTFMNSERRVSRVRRALPPLPGARSDADILCELARRLGHGARFDFDGAESIWNEVRQLWPDGAGISYPRIERQGLQWPCRDEQDPGQGLLHAERFPIGERARLHCADYLPSEQQTDAEFPFLLNSGRTLAAFNAGTMTLRGATLAIRPTDCLDMAAYDAAQLGLHEGDEVELESRSGRCVLPLHIDPAVTAGELYVTFHDPARRVNAVTGDGRDTVTGAPEYKRTAVRVRLLRRAGA